MVWLKRRREARIWRNMFAGAKSKNANSDYRRGRLGRRGHVIFVINVISSALILLISCGVGVTAQQILLPQPVHLEHQHQPLGSLQPDQEAYVFSSSFDTERDRSEWFMFTICEVFLRFTYLHKNRFTLKLKFRGR